MVVETVAVEVSGKDNDCRTMGPSAIEFIDFPVQTSRGCNRLLEYV